MIGSAMPRQRQGEVLLERRETGLQLTPPQEGRPPKRFRRQLIRRRTSLSFPPPRRFVLPGVRRLKPSGAFKVEAVPGGWGPRLFLRVLLCQRDGSVCFRVLSVHCALSCRPPTARQLPSNVFRTD